MTPAKEKDEKKDAKDEKKKPAPKKEVNKLLVMNVLTNKVDTIKNVTSYKFNEDGSWLAYVVEPEKKDSLGKAGLFLYNPANGESKAVLEGAKGSKFKRIDIALRLSLKTEDSNLQVFPLTRVEQVLVASPSYLNHSTPVSRPEDFRNHDLIPVSVLKNSQNFTFQHISTAETISLDMDSRLTTNNVKVAKSLCLQGLGIARLTYLDVQNELKTGALVEVLPEWKLPAFTLNAITSRHDQQPMKIHRCLDALKQYFGQLSSGRNFQEAS